MNEVRRRTREFLDSIKPEERKEVIAEMFGERDPVTLFFVFLAGLDANSKAALHNVCMGAWDTYVDKPNVDFIGPDRITKPAARAAWHPISMNIVEGLCNRV